MSHSQLVEEFDYHDFHLRGYTVGDYGGSIVLDLISGSEPVRTTHLEFGGVESYRFLHTGGAIITYILKVPFMDAIRETGYDFVRDFRQHGGLSVACDSNEEYGLHFDSEGLHTWLIHSAIGFIGMVVARSLESPKHNKSAHPTAGNVPI
jgi:hypothetical protein